MAASVSDVAHFDGADLRPACGAAAETVAAASLCGESFRDVLGMGRLHFREATPELMPSFRPDASVKIELWPIKPCSRSPPRSLVPKRNAARERTRATFCLKCDGVSLRREY